MQMSGQQVLVVGGSSGMGLATARAAALEGARVTIASSRRDRIDAALRELPDGCAGIAVDVRDETQVATALERIGDLDHLVFTAGDNFTPRRLAELDLASAQATLAVRFWGAVTVIKHAITHLRPAGSITLTTGTIGQRPISGAALAAAGAGAAEALVEGWPSNSLPFASTRSVPAPSAHRCGTAPRSRSVTRSSPAWRRARSSAASASPSTSPWRTST